ncbi:hypothetical protein Pmani_026058 [Petrolisthes manimaculis]|uniref:Uncharacterized protein n=1 Tax=Petrolisthes manimaculis TaxID=1843537 RepID=A0AAE1P5G8_9EUCA|nr:hypothetical protein Pmani_026058 [Petrolisthes manimaculis]
MMTSDSWLSGRRVGWVRVAVVSQFVLASSGRHPNWREAVTQTAGVMTFPPPSASLLPQFWIPREQMHNNGE